MLFLFRIETTLSLKLNREQPRMTAYWLWGQGMILSQIYAVLYLTGYRNIIDSN